MIDHTLDTVAAALNVALRHDEEARSRLRRLAGRPLAVVVHGTELRVTAHVEDDRLVLVSGTDPAAAVTISGPPASLMALSTREGTAVLFSGALRVHGDVVAAREWKRLFDRLDPDWEELLAGVVGDIPAHEVGRLAGAVRAWARRAQAGRADDLRAWLVDELETLPARHEVETWLAGVDRLRADTDRLRARVDRLARQAGSCSS